VKYFNNGDSLSDDIGRGINTLANNVACTLGPRGRNVILGKEGKSPIITKDGVTVANFVSLEDPFENVGAQILKQAAFQTNSEAGDGTTTSIVLSRAILNEAKKYIKSGVPPIEIKRGMDRARKEIIEYLENNSKTISSKEDICHVATISGNNDKTIGEIVATAVDAVGKNGAITIEESRSSETFLDLIEGFSFDSGYVASSFTNDKRKELVKYEDCLVLVTDKKLSTIEEMMPVLELVHRDNKPLLIVADDIDGQLLAALIMNVVRGTMKVVAVKAPRYGSERREILSDLALSVGATFITRESNLGLKDIKLKDFGSAKTIEVHKNYTTVAGLGGSYQEVEKRVEELKERIKKKESLDACKQIQERVTRLASGVGVIYVGASTEVEMIEKKHRVEDALEAVRSAREGGIHAGGGVALVRASQRVAIPEELSESQKVGFKIILKAIKEPVRQMATNAGVSADIILDKVENEEDNSGYDFTSDKMVDMLEEGIIDPVKVTCSALKNAVSVVSTLIITDYAVIEK